MYRHPRGWTRHPISDDRAEHRAYSVRSRVLWPCVPQAKGCLTVDFGFFTWVLIGLVSVLVAAGGAIVVLFVYGLISRRG